MSLMAAMIVLRRVLGEGIRDCRDRTDPTRPRSDKNEAKGTEMRSRSVLGIAMAVGVIAAGCSSPTAAAPPKAVNATLTEFKIQADAAKVAAGDVTFTLTNKGATTHEFVIVRTDLAPSALPKDAEGGVAEGGPLTKVDEVEDIEAGKTKTLTVKVEPGKYAYFCNLAGHYAGGMTGGFEVVASAASN